MPTKPTPAPVRFARYVTEGTVPEYRPELGPCLQWTGAKKTRWGYGQFYYEKRNQSAHRAAWKMAHGDIPVGLTVDHLCRNTGCVRVSHLELVTPRENMRRAAEARTSCPNGHAYAEVGVYRCRGKRTCKACRKEAGRKQGRLVRGLPDRRFRHDPATVRAALDSVLAGASVTATARLAGLSPKYLDKLKRRERAKLAAD